MSTGPSPPGPSPQDLRAALIQWLRRQNGDKDASLLDRPFVVTVVGGLFLAFLAHMWDSNEKERERTLTYARAVTSEQQGLIKEFGEGYQRSVSTLNTWFTTVIWIADEQNKKQSVETDGHIKTWKEQAQKLEERYSAAVPLDITLTRVRVLFRCKSVQDVASKMLESWAKLMGTFGSFERAWNDKQSLPDDFIRKNEKIRIDSVDQLEMLETTLVDRMAGELVGARETPAQCPP
jgi:hypothetical protein